jgi:multicomponent Na+:H+ antiporter subunit D
MSFSIHPGFILILGGILTGIFSGRIRQALMFLVPIASFISVLNLKIGTVRTYSFINDLELIYLKVDKLSWIFIFTLALITILANIYALHNKKGGEAVSSNLYAGGAISTVLAGDWMTLIFFWEFMAITSTFLIWFNGTKDARSAGFRYILVHFFGGNFLLAGIFLMVAAGEPNIIVLSGAGGWAYWLILIGIAVNAAIPPLHAWLTDAYPEASITGTIFLNSFTTKVAMYTLIRIFPGDTLLLWLGTIMAFYGVIYAILENNIRRLLSYHIISQMGLIVAGIGIGTDLALNGATALTLSNILYKSLLFMSAGAVIHATGKYKLTDLGGIGKLMPLNLAFFYIGALAISGVPLLNGFVTKSMIISAAAYNQMPVSELLLYLSTIGTFLSIPLKLGYFMFLGPDKGIKVNNPIPQNMYVAMAGLSIICFTYGLFPNLLYDKLPFNAGYQPFTLDHIVSEVQLLVAAFAAFWIFAPGLKTKTSYSLDTDWFYRKPLKVIMGVIVSFVENIRLKSGVLGNQFLAIVIPFFKNPLQWVPLEEDVGPPGYSADKYRFPLGLTVLMCVVVFVITFSYVWLT